MRQPWVLIVAGSPQASDSQSEPFGLAVRRDGLKAQINLAFRSLIRTFDLRSKVLTLEKMQDSLAFLLAYSYLCRRIT